jgi:hypothetical protein
MSLAKYDARSVIEQIEKCNFECEGGPLANNTAYAYLKAHLSAGPKFLPGQWVFYEVKAEVAGIALQKWAKLCVVGVTMSSDTKRQTWTYALTADPPQAYHYGAGVQFNGVEEADLKAEAPQEAPKP